MKKGQQWDRQVIGVCSQAGDKERQDRAQGWSPGSAGTPLLPGKAEQLTRNHDTKQSYSC